MSEDHHEEELSTSTQDALATLSEEELEELLAWAKRVARCYSRRPESGDDIAQDALVAALQQKRPVRHVHALIRKLIQRISWQRYRKPHVEREECDTSKTEESTCRATPEKEVLLEEVLLRLSTRSRDVFALHLAGFTHREIARRLRLSESHVGVIIHRARKRMRVLLGD